ncbi:hypothetical protein AXF42_Ash010129 [Apostasia shenzhenica]|uniref:Uncharacterized protein n=1 Tax=Apostasia shenzhenica TaxID=1088818 RepID=A0A2I0A9J1_9ASPA|nr:hypothetical protein AXF42_Ash010129 [Apostasia shenzhenica]
MSLKNQIIAPPRERLAVASLEDYSDLCQDLRKEKQVNISSRRRYLWEEHLLSHDFQHQKTCPDPWGHRKEERSDL